jgi:hypothetical protein
MPSHLAVRTIGQGSRPFDHQMVQSVTTVFSRKIRQWWAGSWSDHQLRLCHSRIQDCLCPVSRPRMVRGNSNIPRCPFSKFPTHFFQVPCPLSSGSLDDGRWLTARMAEWPGSKKAGTKPFAENSGDGSLFGQFGQVERGSDAFSIVARCSRTRGAEL